MNQPSVASIPVTINSILASVSAFCAIYMVAMSARYFSLAAADINGALGIGMDGGSWLSTAYAITEPVGVVIGSWLGIAFSLRRMLLRAVATFLIATTIPIVYPAFGGLMLCRVITGFAGGVIGPQVIIILLRSWGPTRIPLSLALFLSASTLAPLLAAVLGAQGVAHFGWTFVLWASFPPGFAALVCGYIGLSRERIQWRALLNGDLAGLVALCMALGLFSCAVSQGDRMRWFQSAAIASLLLGSLLCLVVFLVRDWARIRQPILWVSLYRRLNLTLAAIALLPLALGLAISGVIVPTALTQLQHFRPEQLSVALWSASWPQVFSYTACAVILHRRIVEVRTMAVAGIAVVALAAVLELSITSSWQVGEFRSGQWLQGIGLPIFALSVVYMFLGDVRPPLESLPAASILNLSRVLSGTIAAAWTTTSLRLGSQSGFSELLTSTASFPGAWVPAKAMLNARLARSAVDPLLVRMKTVQVIASEARQQAAVLGISHTLTVLAWILFGSCLLVISMSDFGRGRQTRQ